MTVEKKRGRVANLKPFRKGHDPRRNLAGGPKLPDLKEAMARALGGDEAGRNHLERILEALRHKAEAGDVRAAELLLNRGYGMAKQNVDITSAGQPITPPIVWSDAG
jgi:hypothetical protein